MSVPLLLSLLSVLLTPADATRWQYQLAWCGAETDPQIRLACYDALERHSQDTSVLPAPATDSTTAKPAVSTRTDSRFQLDTDPLSGDLTLTRAMQPQGRLTIACIRNITWLRIELAQPWQGNRVITRAGGRAVTSDWFIRDNGMTLEYGRGLPAIATLKSWLDQQWLELDDDNGQSLRVSLSGLSEAIKPLRQQCRWQGE